MLGIPVSGIISSLLLIDSLLAVMHSKKKGFITIVILQVLELLLVAFAVIFIGRLESIPGITMAIFGIAQSFILRHYMKKLKNDEDMLDESAYKDALTGLLNRRGLIRMLESKATQNEKFYLMFCDLDNFKHLNDTLGHDAGDELLKEIGNLWTNLKTTQNYTVFRLGGDEFAVIVNEDKNRCSVLAEEMLRMLIQQKSKYFTYITASIGIASFPEDTNNVQQLITFSDQAMHKAKTSGKNNYYYFDKVIYNDLMKTYETEKYLTEAIEKNLFEIVYQPQVDVKSKKIVGFEALVRLQGKDGYYLNTQDFIQIAEKTGLIFDIDRLVIQKTLQEGKIITDVYPEIIISVNVSGKHITLEGFPEMIYDLIEESSFPRKNLKLEITESSYIQQIDLAASKILKLKRLGIKIALDDFGVGYSSLNYLSKMPVDTIKIDKSFVDVMEEDNSLIDLIIKLGHLIDCDVIAEGVQSETQLNMLEILGCDKIQGFLFGKPESLDRTLDLLYKQQNVRNQIANKIWTNLKQS